MDGKQQIIDRILSDAELKACDVRQKAEEICLEKLKEAEDWAEAYKSEQDKILNKEALEIVERRLTVADLDVRKIILEAKTKAIEEVFSIALDQLIGLKPEKYLAFVEKLLIENAEKGDKVILSSDKVLSAEDIKSLKVFKDRSLSVEKEFAPFKGGVMLTSDSCDKDLTFKAILEDKKSDLVAEIATSLFGGN